ncbi:MAG: thioredoxin [Phycisphaerales bacterium]|nr:thioredoxin [Phycisphaerales bacterium]
MASQNVVQVTDSNFDAEVLQSELPVLLDFWAEWCGPCQMLAPAMEELATEYQGRAKVGKMDTDNNRATAMKFSISALPTVILIHKGQITKRWVGLQPKKAFKEALDSLLGAQG